MIYEATGVLYKDYGEEVIKTANDLHKRRFILEMERKNISTGQEFEPTYPEFELIGDPCKFFSYKVGDKVIVRFEPQGQKYTSKTGEEKYFTKLRAIRVDAMPANYKQPAQANQPTQQEQTQAQPVQGSFDALKQAQNAQSELPF